jgi:VanZ family protein
LALFGFIAAADFGLLHEAGDFVNRHPPLDKILHFVMYGVLALLLNSTLTLHGWPRLRAFALGTIVLIVVSTIEEYSNWWVTMRTCSLGDLAANYLGIIWLGGLPIWCIQQVPAESQQATDATV